jgi:TRAP-type C4-dicarboxylate transport system permease small subunit
VRRRLQALNRRLVALETLAAGGLIGAVAIAVLLQVLMRYLFAYPNPWSEEISRFCFIWASMLGASLAVEHRAHFGFNQVTKGLDPHLRSMAESFAAGVVLMFSLVLVAAGIALMVLTFGERSSALNLPIALVYAAVPVSGALMIVHLLAGGDRSAPGTG